MYVADQVCFKLLDNGRLGCRRVLKNVNIWGRKTIPREESTFFIQTSLMAPCSVRGFSDPSPLYSLIPTSSAIFRFDVGGSAGC